MRQRKDRQVLEKLIVENAVTAANHRFAVAARVKRETEPRLKLGEFRRGAAQFIGVASDRARKRIVELLQNQDCAVVGLIWQIADVGVPAQSQVER